jgi:hypothetical protein
MPQANALRISAFGLGLGFTMALLPLHAQSYITLDYMRGHARPVLIFAPYATPQVIEQLHILAQGQHDMDERNVVPVPLCLKEDSTSVCRLKDVPLSPNEQTVARRRFHIHPNDFTVILLGKDGGEKLRSRHPISLETLRSTIDAMPMRQDEMRSQQAPK